MDSKLFCKLLGKRIKILRELNNLSQDQLATLMGYEGRGMISKIENGHTEPPASKLYERLGRDKKRCPHCGSIHVSDNGYVFKFCPDCGGILNP